MSDLLIYQLIRYAVSGGVINLLSYGLYIYFTSMGLDPKLTISILYITAMVGGYFINSRLTFRQNGWSLKAGIRYLIIQLMGYALNLLILMIFVDNFGINHQVIQAMAIIIVAIFLFILSRQIVFVELVENSKKSI